MVHRALRKEVFKKFMRMIDFPEVKEPETEQFKTEINICGHIYRLWLQADFTNIIYLLRCYEVFSHGEEKVLVPVQDSAKLKALLEAYIFVVSDINQVLEDGGVPA